MQKGPQSAQRQRLSESLIVLVSHKPIRLDPMALLIVKGLVEEFVGSLTVRDRRRSEAEDHISIVVLGLRATLLIPGDAMTVFVRLGFDGNPQAPIDRVFEVGADALERVVRVAPRSGQPHEDAEGEDVEHAPGDGEVDASFRIRFALFGEMSETRGDDRSFCFGDQRLHVWIFAIEYA